MSILDRLKKGAEDVKEKGAKSLDQKIKEGVGGIVKSSSPNTGAEFSKDKTENSQKNIKPGDVLPSNNDQHNVYQGANADGTFNVSTQTSPLMVRRELDKNGNLMPTQVSNAELYAEQINHDSQKSTATETNEAKEQPVPAQPVKKVDENGQIIVDPNSLNVSIDQQAENIVPSKVDGVKIADPAMNNAGQNMTTTDESPQQSDLDFLNSFMPINKEEEEKRTRSANAINGLGALSQAAAAFANYAYTGAPALTLQEYKGADVEKWQDKLREQRLQYLKMKMGIEQNEFNKNKVLQDMEMARNADKRAENADKRAENADKRAENADSRAQSESDVKIEGMKEANKITKAKADNIGTELELENEGKRASIKATQASTRLANTNAAIAQAKQKNEQQKETYYIAAGPDLVGIDKNKVNINTISKVHSMLKDVDGNAIPTTRVKGYDRFNNEIVGNKSLDDLLLDLGQYINIPGNEAALDYVKKNIGGKGKAKIDY